MSAVREKRPTPAVTQMTAATATRTALPIRPADYGESAASGPSTPPRARNAHRRARGPRASLRSPAGSRLLALGPLLALLLGGGCKSAPPAKPSGVLWLNLKPPSATVLVDEQPIVARPGAVTLRIALRAGPHRLELRAPGHFPAYRDLELPSAGELRLDLALRPDPDAEPEAPARPLGQLPTPVPEVP